MAEQIPTVSGVFVYESSRYAKEAMEALAPTAESLSRAVYDLKALQLVGVANPPAFFTRTIAGWTSLKEPDEIARMMLPEYVGPRVAAFARIAQLQESEETEQDLCYDAGEGVTAIAHYTCRPCLRDGDGTVRLFVCDFVMVKDE